MKTKRTVSLALALCLALAFVPAAVAAGPSISLSKTTYEPGEAVVLSISGIPAYNSEYRYAIFKAGAPHTEVLKGPYTARSMGYIIGTGKEEEEGSYEARLYRSERFSDESFVMSVSFTMQSPPNPLDSADTWAHDHITSAISKGFLPESLQNNYKNNITRGEFVILAMSWLRYKTGMTNEELLAQHAKPEHMDRNFSDATNTNILAAARLDITAGTTASVDGKPGVFGADMQFDREQAAIMLMKICRIVGTFEEDVSDFGFTDIGAAQWLPDAINYVGNNEVMSGKGNDRFAPKDAFQRQESIAVFNKMG